MALDLNIRHALAAYYRTRRDEARVITREQLLLKQQKRVDDWLKNTVPDVPFYADYQPRELNDLPIVDKQVVMDNFKDFNCAAIDVSAGWQAFAGSKMIGQHIVGASTGTSGNRGLFVISQAERFRWLGTILAHALPGFWRRRERIAILLPVNTPLYDSANRMRGLQLQFFDLASDPAQWRRELERFDPSVIVATPKVLHWLAGQDAFIAPRKIFSAAEKLEPFERTEIEAYFKVQLGEIYMATEGLFAVTCANGSLHLLEGSMHFELPTYIDNPTLREVIVSDFSRQTQIMARYRMNDLLRLSDQVCACGSPRLVVDEIVGRADDCFHLPSLTDPASTVMLTPDILRNAVVDADRTITDFRIMQTHTGIIEVHLLTGLADNIPAKVEAALVNLLTRTNATAELQLRRRDFSLDTSRKLKRVENRHQHKGRLSGQHDG